MRSHWLLSPYTMWLHYVEGAALRASLQLLQECQKGEYVNTTFSFVTRIFENIVDNLTRIDLAAQKSSALDRISACLVDIRAFQEILACHQVLPLAHS